MAHTFVPMPVEKLLTQVPCTCVDGRTRGMRFSVAGGSFGLIVHLLNAAENDRKSLDQKTIRSVLASIAKNGTPIYLHTDQHAIDLIFAKLALAPDTRLKSLSAEQQRSFIALATQKDYQGCGHLKLMQGHADEYGVTQSLIQRTLAEFFVLFFEQTENIFFEVLLGEHEEEKALIVEEQANLEESQQSALILENPQLENQFFCHRPLKKALMKRFAEQMNKMGISDFQDAELEELFQLHNRHAEITLGYLADGITVETVNL